MASFFTSLPGVQPTLVDGNLQIDTVSSAPRVLIIGTAGKGDGDIPILANTTSEAKSTFGSEGTVLRGIYEAKAQGAENVAGFRIGGTAATLEGIGVNTATGGYKLETSLKDDDAGSRFTFFYDKSEERLAVFDTEDDEWELDTSGVLAPVQGLGDITLSGTPITGEGSDIGSVSTLVAMEDAEGETFEVGDSGVTYTAGTDGLSMSRMELFEALYDAYELLDFYQADIIVPMDVYLDDLNIADMTSTEILTTRDLDSLTDYPTAGSTKDVLGKLFVQEYQGRNYFWWDTDDDGVAEIFPTVGSATASADAKGVALVASDFHEVNFGYQLAEFCHRATKQWQFVIGTISFKLPDGFSLKALSDWVGILPDFTVNPTTQEKEITAPGDNGTGMLGNKFLAGKDDYRGGEAFGGLIETEGDLPTGSWLDGVEVLDENEHVVDLGKYINVLGASAIHTNNFSGEAYISTINASYGGMISTLRPESAPTNKVMKQVRLIRSLKGKKLDDLATTRIVSLVQKPKGVVVTDAPTAARPDSDYQRLTTVRIVKQVVGDIRSVADAFLGEPNSSAQRQALQTAVESKLQELVTRGALLRYDFNISATAAQRVAGQAVINLILIPSFELRQIPVTISLAAE